MDRNKGIWITIACILVVGIAVTLSTSRLVTRQEQSLASAALETSKAAQKERMLIESTVAETAAAKAQADAAAPKAAAQSETQQETQAGSLPSVNPETQEETAADSPVAAQAEMGAAAAPAAVLEVVPESETVQSPLKNAKTPDALAADDAVDLGAYYKKRLEDLDTQLQKMKDADTESTTYSMKSNAEKELKSWDNELNVIYNEILKQLDEEDAKQLVGEERQWMKMRDAAALESSQKYSGGTLEGLEYTATLASYTRDRAYDLVETYLIGNDTN